MTPAFHLALKAEYQVGMAILLLTDHSVRSFQHPRNLATTIIVAIARLLHHLDFETRASL